MVMQHLTLPAVLEAPYKHMAIHACAKHRTDFTNLEQCNVHHHITVLLQDMGAVAVIC
jgi:hypothetical protein